MDLERFKEWFCSLQFSSADQHPDAYGNVDAEYGSDEEDYGTNREMVTIRKKFPGEYVVNLHAYTKSGDDPVPVEVKVYKIKDGRLVHDELIFIEHRGQEKTAIRLDVKEDGSILVKEPRYLPIARDIVR